jgi:hypothetical protein
VTDPGADARRCTGVPAWNTATAFRLARVCLLFAAVGAAPHAGAQSGGPACPIRGRITGPDGAPVAGATLYASFAGGTVGNAAHAVSGADGRYCLGVRDGAEYLMQVEMEGFVAKALLVRAPDASSRTVDVQLVERAAVQLDPVVAVAPPRLPPVTRRGAPPGSELASRAASSASLFPVSPGDLLASAGVSGQYVPVGGEGLSVDGQAPSGNRLTLDGAGFDARDLPAEGLAAAGVFAHPYDVSRGQFTGGEIAGRTMGGTNVWGGALRLSAEGNGLNPEPLLNDPRGARPSLLLLSAGGGGPLVPGRLFAFGSAQVNDRVSGTPPYPSQSHFGIPADSVRRFHEILERLGLGVQPSVTARHTSSATALLRLDYVPSDRHALMLRLDGRRLQSSAPGFPLASSTAANEESLGGGVMAQLTSRLRGAENELTLRQSVSDQHARSAYSSPAGRVWIGSAGDAGGVSGGSIAFGEIISPPAEERTGLELADRLVLTMAGGAHQLQLGGTFQSEDLWRASRADRLGTYTFASLADLEAGRAMRFTRSLGDRSAELRSHYAAVYAGHLWRPDPNFRAVVGLRGERYAFRGSRAANPAADSAFGMAVDPPDTRWSVSPRAGFTWFRSSPTITTSVLGGTGLFRGAAPTRVLAAMLADDGGGGSNLVCVGDGVPAPRWMDFLADAAAIPDECAGTPSAAAALVAGVTGFARDYAPPRLWHTSFGATWLHRPTGTGAEIRAGLSRGWGVPLAVDRNLDASAEFRLAAEGGRPVFLPADAVDGASGHASAQASRFDPRFGVVREVNARGASAGGYLTLGVNRLAGGGLAELYYTYTRSREQSTGLSGPAGGWATTAADPRTAEWAPSDYEQRHAFQLSWVRPVRRWVSATVVWRLLSGAPFTPVVDGDINGDGLSNDRAFVFDPAAAGDRQLAADLDALMHRLPASARSCLARQVGTIAGRNSCRTPWTSYLDLQLNLFPGGPRNKRVVVNVAAENVTSGLDYLFHGREGLHGWGQYPSADPVLLRVVGFDRDRRTYRYAVNPGFGPDAARYGRLPFALRIQARLTLGADPATQALVAQVVASRDRLDPETLRAQMLREWRNVPAAILAYDRTHPLGLTPEQRLVLSAASDSIQAASDRIAGALADGVADLGGSNGAQVTAALTRQRGLLDEAHALLEGGRTAALTALTRQQWAVVPFALRAEIRVPMPLLPEGGVQLLPDF